MRKRPLDAVNKNYVLLFCYPHGQTIRLAAVYLRFQVAVNPTNTSHCLFRTP